jgi:hypothetical protein
MSLAGEGPMAGTMEGRRRPRGAGSIQWRRGRPYAMYRDAVTGKQTWTGFDTEDEADAFLTQWAADRKAARVAARAWRAGREARAPQRRAASSSHPWTFGQLLTDWEDRHRDGVQESTMRDYGPGLSDLRRALGGVLARSLTDEHFEAYKRAKLDGIDVAAETSPCPSCRRRPSTSASTWRARAIPSASRWCSPKRRCDA